MISLWHFSLDCKPESVGAASAFLDRGEFEQASRFKFDKHRRRFVVRRAARRILLADIMNVPPQELRFDERRNRKPVVVDSPDDFDFSTSHASDCGVIVTGETKLGVDVESLDRDVDFLPFARRSFTSEETQVIKSHHDELRSRAFFNCWTGKEAYVKALGLGLQKDLQSFAVCCAPDAMPGLLWDKDTHQDESRWAFRRYGNGKFVVTIVIENAGRDSQIKVIALDLASLQSGRPIFDKRDPPWREI